MARVVGDLGNSRLKLAQVDDGGHLVDSIAMAAGEPETWDRVWAGWPAAEGSLGARWAIATVNPPVAATLRAFLAGKGVTDVTWYQSATQVPIHHALDRPEFAGVDRALAVTAAVALLPTNRPALVVSCGTAITIERIHADGTWQGGVIAPGLGLSARALHLLTAQLPLIELHDPPPPWGRGTRAAIEAGVFWGTVGAVRELLDRQKRDLAGEPAVIWTGGDARLLAHAVEGTTAHVETDLVLRGLAAVAFPLESKVARADGDRV